MNENYYQLIKKYLLYFQIFIIKNYYNYNFTFTINKQGVKKKSESR